MRASGVCALAGVGGGGGGSCTGVGGGGGGRALAWGGRGGGGAGRAGVGLRHVATFSFYCPASCMRLPARRGKARTINVGPVGSPRLFTTV